MTLLRAMIMWLSTFTSPVADPCEAPVQQTQAESREAHASWSAERTACANDDDDDSIYNGF